MTKLFPLHGKGGDRIEAKPRPPDMKSTDGSDLALRAKSAMCAITGMKGMRRPASPQPRWMYLTWCLFSHSLALIGNQIFQNRAAVSINHHNATESVLYDCTIPVKKLEEVRRS